jgi:ABC-type amino acid transport substrate-binding protein
MSVMGGCVETAPQHTGSVLIKGSETMQPLVAMCAEDFMSKHPQVDVMVQGGGSGTGIAALFDGTVDIGMASRDLTPKGPQDLPWVRIATVTGTTGDELLTAQGLAVRRYPFVIQACKALQRGDVEAVVYDKTILSHMIKDYGWGEIEILPQTLLWYDYAIALPPGSPLREPINQALLRAIHQPAWEETVKRYLGAD